MYSTILVTDTGDYTLTDYSNFSRPLEFGTIPKYYFETTMKTASGGTAFARLKRMEPNTAVTYTEISTPLTDYTRVRNTNDSYSQFPLHNSEIFLDIKNSGAFTT